MVITLNGKETEEILLDYAFTNFGKQIGAESKEEILLDIDCNYSSIRKMTIHKKEQEKPQTQETV